MDISQTQEMLDFCAEQNIVADIDTIPTARINDALNGFSPPTHAL